jgi:hypothetical protein
MANYETRIRLISETNVNVANNTSYVTVALDFRRTDYQYYGYNLDGNAYWIIKVDSLSTGNVNFTFNWTIPQNQWKEVARRSFTVTHNADGTKSINLSGTIYFGDGVSPGTLSASGKATLSTIPRATVPSLSPASQAIGSAITINLPRASSAFTHTLTYSFGSAAGTIATGAGGSASWTLPSSLVAQIPNAASGTGQITCSTYNGSTLVGTKYINFTATVPASMVPSISSIGITEAATGINAQFGAYVQNKSRLNIAISASGIQGSTIVSYKTEVAGSSFSGSSVVTGYITSPGSLPVKVTVTDSRGHTAVKTQTVNVVAYANPAIASFTAVRSTTAGVFDDQGTSLSISMNFNVSAVGNKNTKSYAVDLQKNGETTWVSLLKGSVYSYNSTYVADNVLSIDSSYTLRLRVTDYFTTSEAIVDISSGFTLMDFRSTGKGAAVGKVSEKDAFEVGMIAEFFKSVIIHGNGSEYNLFDKIANLATQISNQSTQISNQAAQIASHTTQIAGKAAASHGHNVATQGANGFMAAADKAKLDSINAGNNLGGLVDLINVSSYTFPSDGYLYMEANYRANYYIQARVYGSNGTNYTIIQQSTPAAGSVGNSAISMFVRKGMMVNNISTNNKTYNRLRFLPLQ